jgi:type IV pilus biogenesis protein CpaD/CtpE
MRISLRTALLLGGTATLAGCGPDFDPLTREGLWHPNHANHSNLTLMVANPADLVRGTGTNTADGQLAAAAIDRLRNDKVKKLPASDIANIGASSSGENNGGGGGAP